MSNQTSCNIKKERRTASRKQRAYILLKQKNKCYTCGNFNPNLEVDHVIPYAVGGVTELDNLRALCPNCHADKSRNSDEADKIRFSKRLKFSRCELCWTCEKIVSPYFFKTGECLECLSMSSLHTSDNENETEFDAKSSLLKSKWSDKTWIIPTSPISSLPTSPTSSISSTSPTSPTSSISSMYLQETWIIPSSPIMSDED